MSAEPHKVEDTTDEPVELVSEHSDEPPDDITELELDEQAYVAGAARGHVSQARPHQGREVEPAAIVRKA